MPRSTRLIPGAPPTSNEEFPCFSKGDVCIIISRNKAYTLHSQILTRFSSFFKRDIEQAPLTILNARAEKKGHPAALYHLHVTPANQSGQFLRIPLAENGTALDGSIGPTDGAAARHDDKDDDYWEELFGTFYGIVPFFDDTDLPGTLKECMAVVERAENIGSLEHIREHVELAIMRQDTALWPSIMNEPIVWAELGRRMQSPVIYKEAVIHLIGKWNMLSSRDKTGLGTATYQLCKRKFEELDMAKRVIDIRILGHYPSCLHRNSTSKPYRTNYAQDVFMWQALCFFRQYYAQCVADGQSNRSSLDGGAKLYAQLAAGGDAYLHKEDFRQFHMFFPMSAKACNVLETHMSTLKEEIREFVAGLMECRTHCKPDENVVKEGKGWLVCAVIEKEELPWLAEHSEPATDETGQLLLPSIEDDIHQTTRL